MGRIKKGARQAADPAMEIARLRRTLDEIRKQARTSIAAAMEVLNAAFTAVCGTDRLAARALVPEALIECRFALGAHLVVRPCALAEEGSLCA
ncbi:hypothetical protein ACLBXO_15385 [Methylobacterium sp. C33D]